MGQEVVKSKRTRDKIRALESNLNRGQATPAELFRLFPRWRIGTVPKKLTALLLLWGGAILSAIFDNIPLVITLIPLIMGIAPAMGGDAAILPLWWSLALGCCLGGNGTLIGSAANLTVAGIAERSGVPIGFWRYNLAAFPLMLVSILICHVYVLWHFF